MNKCYAFILLKVICFINIVIKNMITKYGSKNE